MSDPVGIDRLKFADQRIVKALRAYGLHSLWELVELTVTAQDRRTLARSVGVSEGELLKLVRIADMCRVASLELAELLIEAGIHTPLELALRPLDYVLTVVARRASELGVEQPRLEEVEEAWRKSRLLPPLFKY
ncbi:MAG: DUF4332 domain-containing protein [Thermofilaceae archaeon]